MAAIGNIHALLRKYVWYGTPGLVESFASHIKKISWKRLKRSEPRHRNLPS